MSYAVLGVLLVIAASVMATFASLLRKVTG